MFIQKVVAVVVATLALANTVSAETASGSNARFAPSASPSLKSLSVLTDPRPIQLAPVNEELAEDCCRKAERFWRLSRISLRLTMAITQQI